MLQVYSNELLNQVPGYIEKLASSFGPMTLFPNAVGLGALVISMFLEIAIKRTTQTNDNSYSMFRRVFGEEKASSVRDTMSEYLRRHRMFMNNDRRLREEIQRLEIQLSNHLTILRNSLMHDGQMNTRGIKIWVNGASFHLQMLIHEARLNIQTGRHASDYLNTIKAAISTYLLDLDNLLPEYKTLKINNGFITYYPPLCSYYIAPCSKASCLVQNDLTKCGIDVIDINRKGFCERSDLMETYMNHVFTKYEPISGLKSYFSNIKDNLSCLINQHGSFTLPSAG